MSSLPSSTRRRLCFLLCLAALCRAEEVPSPLPIVLWHGLGETCCREHIGQILYHIRFKYRIFVHSIALGRYLQDWESSYLGHVDDQILEVCQMLREMPQLRNGYNAIGFSQGGQFLRAVVQRCQHLGPQMKTLITIGSQHQGVMSFPGCDIRGDLSMLCKFLDNVVDAGAYVPTLNKNIIPAQYFKDPYRMDEYLETGAFLTDINGDVGEANQLYKSNLITLEKFIMVRFAFDYAVIPRDSSWFGFFNGTHSVPLREQPVYTDNRLGLQELDAKGGLIFIDCATQHMGFDLDWFDDHIMSYLLPNVTSRVAT